MSCRLPGWSVVVLAVVVTMLSSATVAAMPAIVVDASQPEIALGSQVELRTEAPGLGIDEIAATSEGWSLSQETVPNFSYSDRDHWVRLRIANPDAQPLRRLLEIAYAPLDLVELYTPRPSGGYDRRVNGDSIPLEQREVKHRHPVFSLTLPAQSEQILLLRVRSAGLVQLPLTLWSPEAFWSWDHEAQLVLGFFYGIVFVMAVYNLFLFVFLRDRSYLFYVAFLTGIGLFELTETGLAYEYLWPSWPWWASRAALFSLGLATSTGGQFVRLMLPTRASPRLDKALLVGVYAGIATMALSLVMDFGFVARLSTVVVMYEILVAAATLFVVRRAPSARYFLMAWSVFLAGSVLNALAGLGIAPANFITSYGLQVGTAVGVVLLSLGLADRIQSLRVEKEAAETASNIDGLTGLANRRRFDAYLQQEWSRAARAGLPLSLALVDVDFFKLYNDRHGHLAGDDVLRSVGEALRRSARRAGDLVARYGGEEFAIVLPATDDKSAAVVARRLQEAVEKLAIVHGGSAIGPHVTISVGVATSRPRHEAVPTELIAASDRALYQAKQGGRNRVVELGAVSSLAAEST